MTASRRRPAFHAGSVPMSHLHMVPEPDESFLQRCLGDGAGGECALRSSDIARLLRLAGLERSAHRWEHGPAAVHACARSEIVELVARVRTLDPTPRRARDAACFVPGMPWGDEDGHSSPHRHA